MVKGRLVSRSFRVKVVQAQGRSGLRSAVNKTRVTIVDISRSFTINLYLIKVKVNVEVVHGTVKNQGFEV